MKNIQIFLACDDKYAPYMLVTMVSVLQNTTSSVDFYVLDGGISDERKLLIEETVSQYKLCNHCEYIKMDISLVAGFPNLQHFSLNTYFRYFIADLKPDLDKALYLDCDMVVIGDITEIYDINVDNYGIAAVPYICNDRKYSKTCHYKWVMAQKQRLNMKASSLYFNAGLLLMNLQYIRKNNLKQQFINKTTELKDIITCPDQDVLNIIFENKYKILPLQYNIVVDITSQILDINQYIRKFSNSCFVIHYTGGQGLRPWLGGTVLAEYFWDIAKKTPFYKMLKDGSLQNVSKANLPKYEILYSYSIWNIPIFVVKRKIKDQVVKYWLLGILIYKRRE